MLVWNVYIEDFNKKEIIKYNIFNHYRFEQKIVEAKNKYPEDKTLFLKEVERGLRYYFWSKCEWEILIGDWPPSNTFNEKKVDVYDQVCLNWDAFCNYLWDNKELL